LSEINKYSLKQLREGFAPIETEAKKERTAKLLLRKLRPDIICVR
jgi:hypothetical protein